MLAIGRPGVLETLPVIIYTMNTNQFSSGENQLSEKKNKLGDNDSWLELLFQVRESLVQLPTLHII